MVIQSEVRSDSESNKVRVLWAATVVSDEVTGASSEESLFTARYKHTQQFNVRGGSHQKHESIFHFFLAS